MPPTDLYPLRRSDVNLRELDGEMVVLDRQLQRIHQLNQTASCVWVSCNGQHSVRDIAQKLVDRYDIDEATALKDAEAALQRLAEAGLLEDESATV